jgi:hypothetical protein
LILCPSFNMMTDKGFEDANRLEGRSIQVLLLQPRAK